MAPDEFRKAGERLYLVQSGAECPTDVQLFRFLGERLRSDKRTISRWIYGERAIPGPAEVALECLLRLP